MFLRKKLVFKIKWQLQILQHACPIRAFGRMQDFLNVRINIHVINHGDKTEDHLLVLSSVILAAMNKKIFSLAVASIEDCQKHLKVKNYNSPCEGGIIHLSA